MTTSSPNFDSLKNTNVYGEEYWSARDLAPLLGYEKWQRFQDALRRAQIACEQSGNTIQDHFTGAGKMVQVGSGAKRKVTDVLLSRFACYLIAQNGDPRKPEIAAAQAYFAVSTRAHEMHQLRKEQEERLEVRLKVSESYKKLAEAAHKAGVQSETFGIFVDAGYLGLHHHTLQELKDRKGVAKNEDYLDRVTRQELSAIDFKNTQTEGKLLDEHITGVDNASQTHYFVGNEVRKAIEAIHGPMPEDLPSAASIRGLVEARRRKGKKRVKKAEEEESGQNSLF